jgi:excisionase family DNA binding protein
MNSEEQVLTLQEAANFLKVKPITIRRLIARGHLHSVKVLGLIRIPTESMQRLVRVPPR